MDKVIESLWQRVDALRIAVIALHREARCYENKKDVNLKEVGELLRSLADELSEHAKKIQLLIRVEHDNDRPKTAEDASRNPGLH